VVSNGFLENRLEKPPEKALDMLKLGILWFMNMPRFMGFVEEYINGWVGNGSEADVMLDGRL